jgi:hypothetical protein
VTAAIEERKTMLNGIAKSPEGENLLKLVTETLADAYRQLHVKAPHLIRRDDETRDVNYLVTRYESEGLAFLTIALPRLGDWLDKLVRGVELQRVEGFKPYDGLYPTFLRPFWVYLQNEQRVDHWISVYRILRTLLHGLKKLELPIQPELRSSKLSTYLVIEDELESMDWWNPSTVCYRAQALLSEVLAGYTPTNDNPTHGPGAVAGGEKGRNKWNWNHLYESVHRVWPYWDHIFPGREVSHDGWTKRNRPMQLAAMAKVYKSMTRLPYPTSRMLFVPKDSRGPRIISCEPKELMYIQQGVSKHLVSYIETNVWTSGHVNFKDQTINAQLALHASVDRVNATLDMSDASDRVSRTLVSFLLPKGVFEKLDALRSHATILPNGEIMLLRKFAPMGSALCFPIESLVFWSLCVAVGSEFTDGCLQSAARLTYVYGDDLVIPSAWVSRVVEEFTKVCLRVNLDKSFYGSTPFRESCGVDAFDGHDVSINRVKKLPPWRPSDGTAIVAYLAYASNSLELGMHRRAQHLAKIVEDLVGPIPRVRELGGFLAIVDHRDWWDYADYVRFGFRPTWSAERCTMRIKALCIRNKMHGDVPSNWSRLQRNFTMSFSERDPSLVVDTQSTKIVRKLCDLAITR